MAIYKIPTQDFEGFELIMSLKPKIINEINKAINSSEKILTPPELIEFVSEQVEIDPESFKKILRIINSLSTLRKDDDITKEEITESIVDSLKEIEEEPFKSETKWAKVKKNLLDLMVYEEKIILGYKTISLAWEFDKIYVDSRIVTDIRPVFEENLDKDINNSIIAHNLKNRIPLL